MRTIKELLELMLEHQKYFSTGLCYWAESLYWYNNISLNEYLHLLKYIRSNRPSKYSSLSAYKYRHCGYYWQSGDIKPRIKWIKKHIKKLS